MANCVIVIGLEIALALFKLFKGQWTYKIAIFNTIYEVIATVVIIVIMINPNLFQPEFFHLWRTYFPSPQNDLPIGLLAESFSVCDIWWNWGIIDGFRKARIR